MPAGLPAAPPPLPADTSPLEAGARGASTSDIQANDCPTPKKAMFSHISPLQVLPVLSQKQVQWVTLLVLFQNQLLYAIMNGEPHYLFSFYRADAPPINRWAMIDRWGRSDANMPVINLFHSPLRNRR